MSSYESEFNSVTDEIRAHERWFSQSLPMIASENLASEPVRKVLSSDLGHRYAEGWPGERVYAGCKYIDQIELRAIALGKKLFRAEHLDVRPVSGVNANLAVYSALTSAGDMMVAMSVPNGGHISHGKKDFGGTAGLVHSLDVSYFAFDKEAMNIDVDATKKRIAALPSLKLAMFGCSLFLFPHPVKELAQAIHDKGGSICYDAAHVAGLIAGGEFQDPLREGAQVMTMSTHKVLFGPQGGAIASTAELAEPLKKAVFPGTTSSHHLNNVAAKAMVFAEFLQFGQKYAKDVVANAQTLAGRLAELGEKVLGEKGGYTMSHQVALDVMRYTDGGVIEKRLEDQNIICNREPIPGDLQAGRHYMNPGGIRLGVSELTRLGMGRSEMKEVAELVHLGLGGAKKEEVVERIKELRKGFQKVKYSFRDTPAYSFG
ncbi:MAG: serine hydroxymethyltransferase [Nitrososphaerota archaeon]|nr:serine hydroxymethyltransferase [Nitrososphaerota archaeon]